MLTTMTTMMSSAVDAVETADDLQADENEHAPSPAQHRDRPTYLFFTTQYTLKDIRSSFQQLVYTIPVDILENTAMVVQRNYVYTDAPNNGTARRTSRRLRPLCYSQEC